MNVKYYRDRRGMTQAELAVQADCSNGLIGNIEAGNTHPSFDTIVALARALGVHPAWWTAAFPCEGLGARTTRCQLPVQVRTSTKALLGTFIDSYLVQPSPPAWYMSVASTQFFFLPPLTNGPLSPIFKREVFYDSRLVYWFQWHECPADAA